MTSEEESQPSGGGYEPPSFQPYSYEPPTYHAEPATAAEDDEGSEPKPKKKSFMDDDEDDIPALKPQDTKEKSKAEKDRENEEMFRKAAEEDGRWFFHCRDSIGLAG